MESLRKMFGPNGMDGPTGHAEHARATAHTPNGNLDILARASCLRKNLPAQNTASPDEFQTPNVRGMEEDNQDGYGGDYGVENHFVTPEKRHTPAVDQERPSVHGEDEQPAQSPSKPCQR